MKKDILYLLCAESLVILLVAGMIIFQVPVVSANVQDFTTWDEIDPDNKLTVTSSTVSGTTFTIENYYGLEKDWEAGYWNGDFTHKFELIMNAFDVEQNNFYFCFNTSLIVPSMGLDVRSPTVSDYKIFLWTMANEDGSTDLDFGTTYFITVSRTGTVITATIRTGSHTGTVIDTLQIDETLVAFDVVIIPFLFTPSDPTTFNFALSNFDDGISPSSCASQLSDTSYYVPSGCTCYISGSTPVFDLNDAYCWSG